MIGYKLGGVGIYFGRIISCILVRVSCHDWMFSMLSGKKWLQKLVSLRIKQLLRLRIRRSQFIQPPCFELLSWCLYVCEFVCIWALFHCSLLHVHSFSVYMNVHHHILLVFQNLTALTEHWLFILEMFPHAQTCLSLPGSAITEHVWQLVPC